VRSPTLGLFQDQMVRFVVNAPYSAMGTTQSVTRFPDGTQISQSSTAHYFRDSQGRTRVERPLSEVDSATIVMIHDIVAGQQYILHPQPKTAQVLEAPKIQPASPQPGAPPGTELFSLLEGAVISLDEQEFEGIKAAGKRWEHTYPVGVIGNDRPIAVTVERWDSTELGVVVHASQRTSTGTELSYQLHTILRAEPDAALFGIPDGYTREVAQSTLIRATRKDD
jgi:hypothetical protein